MDPPRYTPDNVAHVGGVRKLFEDPVHSTAVVDVLAVCCAALCCAVGRVVPCVDVYLRSAGGRGNAVSAASCAAA
eukprot:831800-Pyramimonas_sp.AAC.1